MRKNACVRVICTADKMPAIVDKMLVSVDIILDFDDIIYTELCFPIFFSYVYTYTADFVYSRRKNASFSICLQLL